ncbi:hypothetical protein Tco_0747967 [Tanacetum coccineum]|uniref:Uncharacterized protein n=1 Tax=Tanacetum coccineum TaxID=301880 RepID=A0ABQ4YV67_9ASTR
MLPNTSLFLELFCHKLKKLITHFIQMISLKLLVQHLCNCCWCKGISLLNPSIKGVACLETSLSVSTDSLGSLKVMLLALGIVEGAVVVVLCTGSCTTVLDFALLNSVNA